MEPEGVRIKLNLSEFFNDKRKYSYMFIEHSKINDFFDLESRIRNEFDIEENIIFSIDNVFVPHSESIKLLHEEETLTLSADAIGLNYLKSKYSQKSQTKCVRERKRKKKVCQQEDERGESGHYFQSDDEEKKKKKQSSKMSDFSKFTPSTHGIKLDMDIDDTQGGLENKMFKDNEVFDFSRYECEETPTCDKKTREKKVKKRSVITEEQIINKKHKTKSFIDNSQINFHTADTKKYSEVTDYINQEQDINRNISDANNIKGKHKRKAVSQQEVNNICPTETIGHQSKVDEDITVELKSETNLNENHEWRKITDLSENSYINNIEISIPDKSCNPINDISVVNDEPSSIDDNCSLGKKRKRIRTRRRKKNDQLSISGSQNTSGTCEAVNMLSGSFPEVNHIRFSDEVSDEYITDSAGVKGNLNEFDEAGKQKRVCINSGNNDLNKAVNSTHLRADTSQIPAKSTVCLAEVTTPTPVDTFNKLLSLRKNSSTPFVFNRVSNYSNTLPEAISEKKHEQSDIIDCELDDNMIVEKYPLIKSPKKGDILAFKLYRMASDYTPHITSYIIATVIQYCAETCQLTVKVKRGLDQLQEPQGRFSLFEDIEKSCEQNDMYEFNWNELMETRLLFP